jgi:hypothetical protein
MAPAADADKSALAIMSQLGIDKNNVGALQEIPAEQLLKAMSASIKVSRRRASTTAARSSTAARCPLTRSIQPRRRCRPGCPC